MSLVHGVTPPQRSSHPPAWQRARRRGPQGRALLALVTALLLLAAGAPAAQAAWGAQGEVLCPPWPAPDRPLGCAPLGSAPYVDAWAQQGITFPLTPLPYAAPISRHWFQLPEPMHFAYVQGEKARMYHRRGDALDTERPAKTYPPGLVYVSYDWVTYSGRQRIYRVDEEANLWMLGKDLLPVTPSPFRGLRLRRTPARPFGWVVAHNIHPRAQPGLRQQPLSRTLARYTVIQVFAQREVDGMTWYLVGPDMWLSQRWVALVFPRSEPPPGVTTPRWIEINLYEQTLAAYEEGQLVFATLVSTGVPPFWTRPGLFTIYEKHRLTDMRGAFEADRSDYYMIEDVPWTMYFDEARALHGAYWHDGFGFRLSHGCVNLSIADANWLFHWAQLGDQVYVWDPSGKTPTDPDLYGSGGF